MTWFYAVGQQQQGPVTEDQLRALAKDGVVTAETLVWREGLANWQPYRSVAPVTDALPPAVPGAVTVPVPAVGGGVSEQEILAREYRVDIGEALSQSWKVFTTNAGVIIGACVVLLLVSFGVGMISMLLGLLMPFANIFISMFLNGVITGGALWFFLRMVRGETGKFEDVFAGFGPRFWQLGLAALVQGLINVALVVPGAVAAIVLGVFSIANLKSGSLPDFKMEAIALLALIAAITVIVLVFVNLLWTFSLLLVMDKGYDFWPAMQLSRRMVKRRWWMTLLFVVVGGIISMLGALACFVGLLVTVPLFYGMYAHFYDANFRDLAPARRE